MVSDREPGILFGTALQAHRIHIVDLVVGGFLYAAVQDL
jgi:hypothetical protein